MYVMCSADIFHLQVTVFINYEWMNQYQSPQSNFCCGWRSCTYWTQDWLTSIRFACISWVRVTNIYWNNTNSNDQLFLHYLGCLLSAFHVSMIRPHIRPSQVMNLWTSLNESFHWIDSKDPSHRKDSISTLVNTNI